MQAVAANDAKDRFSELIERVEQGEEVVITRDGRPIAKIVGETSTAPSVREMRLKNLDDLWAAAETASLGGVTWKELRDAGRR